MRAIETDGRLRARAFLPGLSLLEAWERRHYPMELPDPVEAIRFEMERQGLTVKDLEPLIGRANRVYEVLARKRPLTLRMIRRLHEVLGIPAEGPIKDSAADLSMSAQAQATRSEATTSAV